MVEAAQNRIDAAARQSLGALGGEFMKGWGISRASLSDDGVPCIRYGEIYTTYGEVTDRFHSRAEYSAAAESLRLETGDIIFAASGETVEDIGKSVAYLGKTPAVAGGDTIVFRGHGQDAGFLGYALSSYDARRQKAKFGQGQTIAHIHPPNLEKIEIWLPPLPEQGKISETLRAWDEAIKVLRALRGAKKKRLQGLTSRMVNGQEFERQRIHNFLQEISERNGDEKIERVLSVTNSAGFVLAEKQFAHRVASVDTTNYKIVSSGQYAYNPSRINVGSIARLNKWDVGALSPMYVVFAVEQELDSDFFGHWLASPEAKQRIRLAAQGSVRETVGFDDLGAIMIPFPPKERQIEIARLLNAAREDVRLTEQKIEALKRQKRGLMQKLLTGEWRVTP